VWETQALTRARYACGDAALGQRFEEERAWILSRVRDLPTLRKEVLAMRQKMVDGHPNNSGLFDLKHDRGGMVDIEFIVQYLVLAHCSGCRGQWVWSTSRWHVRSPMRIARSDGSSTGCDSTAPSALVYLPLRSNARPMRCAGCGARCFRISRA
jgi:glutamine synthetase adenylyltransferase